MMPIIFSEGQVYNYFKIFPTKFVVTWEQILCPSKYRKPKVHNMADRCGSTVQPRAKVNYALELDCSYTSAWRNDFKTGQGQWLHDYMVPPAKLFLLSLKEGHSSPGSMETQPL